MNEDIIDICTFAKWTVQMWEFRHLRPGWQINYHIDTSQLNSRTSQLNHNIWSAPKQTLRAGPDKNELHMTNQCYQCWSLWNLRECLHFSFFFPIWVFWIQFNYFVFGKIEHHPLIKFHKPKRTLVFGFNYDEASFTKSQKRYIYRWNYIFAPP